jgi:hypothetical protein
MVTTVPNSVQHLDRALAILGVLDRFFKGPQVPEEILGLKRSATESDIRSSRNNLARLCHPDYCPGGQSLAKAATQLVNAAFDMISGKRPIGNWPRLEVSPGTVHMLRETILEHKPVILTLHNRYTTTAFLS